MGIDVPEISKGMEGKNLWFLSLVAAMGGFLFGYDTAVINGAEQQIQSGWRLSGLVHGWVMSAALITQPCTSGESDHTLCICCSAPFITAVS